MTAHLDLIDPAVHIVCDFNAAHPYLAQCQCGHRLEGFLTEDAARAAAEAHRDDYHHGHAVIARHPSVPIIPDIYEGMFDHCLTIDEAQSEWDAIRTRIPRWHNDAQTRGRLARIAGRRWDALRNRSEAATR